jgi:hypothetical protein
VFDGEDLDPSRRHSIDDSVRSLKNLAKVIVRPTREAAAAQRRVFQLLGATDEPRGDGRRTKWRALSDIGLQLSKTRAGAVCPDDLHARSGLIVVQTQLAFDGSSIRYSTCSRIL